MPWMVSARSRGIGILPRGRRGEALVCFDGDEAGGGVADMLVGAVFAAVTPQKAARHRFWA